MDYTDYVDAASMLAAELKKKGELLIAADFCLFYCWLLLFVADAIADSCWLLLILMLIVADSIADSIADSCWLC